MINETYKAMLGGKSVIRTLSEYATARGTEIGYDNVFDYSLGNPSVPCPSSFTKAMIDMYETADPVALHGYSPSLGNPEACRTIAESLNRRFGMDYTAGHIFPTTGAAGALAHALRAVTKPGDEVLTFAPYFPEYHPYVEGAGARLTVVPADIESFQINFAAFEAALNPEVTVVLINTPNNPSGAVYSAETLDRLAGILRAKQAEYGHDIFLISDEPYREIVFDGGTQPYPAKFYDNTLTCYSWSKSLSMPGERIGYVLVPQSAEDWARVYAAVAGAGRGIGYINAPSLFQHVAAACDGLTADLSVYETNRNRLYRGLTEMGYTCVKPDGTFYLIFQAPDLDSMAFSKRAMKYDLLVAPTDTFGCPGYLRVAFCVDTGRVEKALPVFRRLAQEYGLCK